MMRMELNNQLIVPKMVLLSLDQLVRNGELNVQKVVELLNMEEMFLVLKFSLTILLYVKLQSMMVKLMILKEDLLLLKF